MQSEQQGARAEISLKSVAFRGFTYNFATGQLRRGSRLVHLRPRASRALGLLLARPGELVTHDALRTLIWGETIVEWQAGLHQLIRELRAALDRGGERTMIETVSRHGYRFLPRVRAVQPQIPWSAIGAVSVRELAFLGGGALLLPLALLATCVIIGMG